jgi:uncharacterized membrane protein
MLGTACGMRAFSGPAALAAWTWPAARSPGGRIVRTALIVAGAGEVVADKLPRVPDRVVPGALAVRVITAAMCGGRTAGSSGAASAALAAAVSAAASYRVRVAVSGRAPVGAPIVGVAEDIVVYGLAIQAARLGGLTPRRALRARRAD